jgi:hypothetical protein
VRLPVKNDLNKNNHERAAGEAEGGIANASFPD